MSRLEDIREELYSKKPGGPPSGSGENLRLGVKGEKVRMQWSDPMDEVPTLVERSYLARMGKKNLGLRFLIFAGLLVFLGIAVFAVRSVFVARSDVDFEIIGPDQITAGEPTIYIVRVLNRSGVALRQGIIDLVLPDGALYPGGGEEALGPVRRKLKIEDVPPGGEVKQDLQMRFLGALDQNLTIEGTYVYKPENIQSFLTRSASFKAKIARVPVAVGLDAPEKISSGQEVVLTIGIDSDLVSPLPGMALGVDFPSGFKLVAADPPPTDSDSQIWALGDLSSGVSKKITIRAQFTGEPEEVKALHLRLGRYTPGSKTWIVITELSRGPTIASPFLFARVALNGSRSGSFAPGAHVDGNVFFKNNLSQRVENVSVSVFLPERFVELQSVRVDGGFYDAIRKAVVWNPASTDRLREVGPTEEGTLLFSFDIKGTLPIFSFSDKNFVFPVVTAVDTGTPPPEFKGVSLEYRDKTEFKIESRLIVNARTTFYDSPAANSGPLPPKVRRATTYTVFFQLNSGANDLKDVEVKGELPGGVGWKGLISSDIGQVSYNPATHEVIWRIPRLAAGTGVLRSPAAAVVQVSLTPAENQIDSSPSLMTGIAASGLDTFTNVVQNDVAEDLTTELRGDPQSKFEEWRVVR